MKPAIRRCKEGSPFISAYLLKPPHGGLGGTFRLYLGK